MTESPADAFPWTGRIRAGEARCIDVIESSLARIEQLDDPIGAFLTVFADRARGRAESIDDRIRRGERVGMLAGVPIATKANICIEGCETSCGSRILDGFVSPYNAHVVDRLLAEDAVLLGTTNMDEFAMGSSTENSASGATRNPLDHHRSPGGSSGGSAAAVAADMVPLALGSDTGGSIRQPAAFCGVVGIKPTYGRVSRYGLIAFASSLDQIGPIAADVRSAALLLEAIAGWDRRDSTSVQAPAVAYSRTIEEQLSDLRIGVPTEHFAEGLDAEVESAVNAAIDVYRSLGAHVTEITLPHTKYAVATYYLVASSEASGNLARYDGIHYGRRATRYSDLIDMYTASRGEGFGPEAKRRIMLGTYALSAGYYDAYYLKALKVRRLIRQDFDAVFGEVDVVAGPVTPTPAFKLGELIDDPLAMYLSDVCTIGASLAGLPALSLPCGFTADGLPIGLQLTAPHFEEDRLLRAARMYERETKRQGLSRPGKSGQSTLRKSTG